MCEKIWHIPRNISESTGPIIIKFLEEEEWYQMLHLGQVTPARTFHYQQRERFYLA